MGQAKSVETAAERVERVDEIITGVDRPVEIADELTREAEDLGLNENRPYDQDEKTDDDDNGEEE
jgi:hypothetical protein